MTIWVLNLLKIFTWILQLKKWQFSSFNKNCTRLQAQIPPHHLMCLCSCASMNEAKWNLQRKKNSLRLSSPYTSSFASCQSRARLATIPVCPPTLSAGLVAMPVLQRHTLNDRGTDREVDWKREGAARREMDRKGVFATLTGLSMYAVGGGMMGSGHLVKCTLKT